MLNELAQARRPLLIFGAGVRGCAEQAEEFRRSIGAPLLVTWGARDVFPDAPSFGTHGERAGNFAAQTADYILTVGTRLDTKATGTPAGSFAPRARLVMVDIDQTELDKMAKIGRPLHRAVAANARGFLNAALEHARAMQFPDWPEWKAKLLDWRARFPVVDPAYRTETTINPYVLVDRLSDLMVPADVLASDTGCSVAWLMQAFRFRGQRFVHAFNNTPMGYGLPAAIGAAVATGGRVVLVTGDGGLGECATEFATVARHGLPVKTLLLNNRGHAMCRQTQRQWLGGAYPATSYDGGLATPDFVRIAGAHDIPARRVSTAAEIDDALRALLSEPGPGFLECVIPEDAGVVPMVRFGKGIEDADPELPDVAGILAEGMA
jgi:acetolactate synthase-1/2/3 large subunit